MLASREDGPRQKSWSRSPLVINDITQDNEFKDQSFVARHPSLRFYAAMPISTRSGFNIGTLSVMDDRPREGLGSTETEFLCDMSHAIMAHLEMTRSNEGHRRTEKMVKGLGVFMEGGTDLGDWWLELGSTKPRRRDVPEDGTEGDNKKREEYGGDCGGTSAASRPGSKEFPPQQPPKTAVPATADSPSPLRSGQSVATFTLDLRDRLVSQSVKEMFSRASNIIQECIEVDGAIFLDANIHTRGRDIESDMLHTEREPPRSATGDTESSDVNTGDSDHALQLPGETPTGKRGVEQKMCGVLGFRTGKHSSMHGDTTPVVPPAEAFLETLLRKYPNGHVFQSGERSRVMPPAGSPGHAPEDEAGAEYRYSETRERLPEEAAEHREAKILLRMLPGARSIAFIPLWDSHRDRWFAGSFFWIGQQTPRVLTHTEDLNYLAAFGNSIMAEVARLDAVNADRAKSDFISSISHELRSPLHGILASVEFLQDTTVNSFQHGMIDTIERCGRTLLDTIQHVLDFTKINTFVRSDRIRRSKPEPGGRRTGAQGSGLTIDVDLSFLAEDVIDSMFAGHEFYGQSSLVVADGATSLHSEAKRKRSTTGPDDGNTASNRPGLTKERVEVAVDIGWRPNWTFNTQSGALRRILMNLFGNALKYTSKGWIKVSLQAQDIDSTQSKPGQSVITITVSDSGRGISQEYLHGGLFTPFTQENPMNQGTGLGLSIVQQLVGSLGGTIDITSEQGVGTEVVVTLTLNQALSADRLPLTREDGNIIQATKKKTTGLTMGLLGFDVNPATPERRADDGKVGPEPAPPLRTSLIATAKHWFDMEVSAPQTWGSSPPDVYVANEQHARRAAASGIPTIVLCSYEALHREYCRSMMQDGQGTNNGLVHFVSEPCGPHKLAKALAYCVVNTPHAPRPFSPGLPNEALAFPQSLFRRSHAQDEYVPPAASRADELPAPAVGTNHPEKRKPMLLLVDDNKINLQLLYALVSKDRYPCDTAANGLEALRAFQNAQKLYDIVFMDVSMPVMDGIEATREIRRLERDRRQKPAMIIALTGLGSATSQQDAFSSGVNLYLTKPVRFSDLRDILSDWTPDDTEMESRLI
ncbi:hypothetical protein RB595_004846 [Gaeumannomyces hyphopodioides]